jgi:twitching motility two-component system response regulator PilG
MPQQTTYTVGGFGLQADDRRVIERVFALSLSRQNGYRLAADSSTERPHVVLVDVEVPEAVTACKEALKGWGKPPPLVTVARTAPANCRYYLRRPFMATRLLGVLDEAVLRGAAPITVGPELGAAPAAGPAPGPVPVARPAAGVAPSPTAAPATPGLAPADSELRYRALVVDDSLAVRKQIGIALEQSEIRPEYANCGEVALELLGKNSYDIIFLDVVMPGIDGYSVCRSIKRNRATRHIPVIMLTGKSSPFDKVKGKLSGCNTYLTKPVARKAFEDTLKAYLKQPIVQD